jgi:hypothetical protein
VDSGNGFGTRVFWTSVIPNTDLQFHPGAGTVELSVQNLPVFDYAASGFAGNVSLGPQWQTAYVPATASFDVVWNGPVTRQVNVRDATYGFAGTFLENQTTVTWSAQSASGFSFTANPGNFSTSVPETPGVSGVTAPLNFFAEVGSERNGIFFSGRAPLAVPAAGTGSAAAPLGGVQGGQQGQQAAGLLPGPAPLGGAPALVPTVLTGTPLPQLLPRRPLGAVARMPLEPSRRMSKRCRPWRAATPPPRT